MNKYDVSNPGTISRWNQEYDKGILDKDNLGKKKYNQELEDIDILKKILCSSDENPLSSNTNREISNN